MSLKKSVCLVTVGSLVGALAYGCSSSSSPGTGAGQDAGATMDSSMQVEAAADTGPIRDAATDKSNVVCAPQDVSTFMPPAYVPAHQQLGVCTDQQISDFFTACHQVGHTKAMCDTFKAGAPACSACIEGPASATSYGANVIFPSGHVIYPNIAGCMEILGGAAGLTCARAFQAAEECTDTACATNCPITDDASFQLYVACTQQAATGGCMSFEQTSSTCSMGLDGGTSVCLSGADFATAYAAITPIFCGSASTDAGGGG